MEVAGHIRRILWRLLGYNPDMQPVFVVVCYRDKTMIAIDQAHPTAADKKD